jgi:hypothetical protein
MIASAYTSDHDDEDAQAVPAFCVQDADLSHDN